MRSPVSRLSAAVVFATAITGVGLLFHGGGATTALAEFVAPILDAKNIKFKTTTEMKGQPPTAGETIVIPPARMRQEIQMPDKSKTVMIWDWEQGKALTLIPNTKQAIVSNFSVNPKGDAPKNPFREFLSLLLDAQEDNSNFNREPLGEKEIDGRHVVGYRLTGRGQVIEFWGDPTTNRPVLIEQTLAIYPGAKTTMSDFAFDMDVDATLFSVEPPAGYQVMKAPTIDLSVPMEKDLVETFRGYSQLSEPLPTKDVYSPTGGDYRYKVQGNRFTLSSCGEDGVHGNADDDTMISGVGIGQQHELEPPTAVQEEQKQTETALEQRSKSSVVVTVRPAKPGVADELSSIDPKVRKLGEAVGKRLTTYSDEQTLILKNGQTGRMKIKKNVTPVAEILVTAQFMEHGTKFDMEALDATGMAIEGTKTTSGTIHHAQTERSGLGKQFIVDGEPILSKIQLRPTRQKDNRVAVEVKVLFTSLPTPAETEAMLLIKGKSGQVQLNFMEISRSLMLYQQRTGHYPKTLADMNDGAFPDSLDMAALLQALVKKFPVPRTPREFPKSELLEAQATLQRGIMFAQQLPPEADAHYAGKGVSPGAHDTPIFWYRPKASKKYRVIYADLSVLEAEARPNVPNAQPMPTVPTPEAE